VGGNQIQETGSDLFLGLLFSWGIAPRISLETGAYGTRFWGKSILTKKKKSKICPGNDSEGPMVRTLTLYPANPRIDSQFMYVLGSTDPAHVLKPMRERAMMSLIWHYVKPFFVFIIDALPRSCMFLTDAYNVA
jgi:hypothetical protein